MHRRSSLALLRSHATDAGVVRALRPIRIGTCVPSSRASPRCTSRQRRALSTTNTTSWSTDDCPHRQFAQAHPDIARRVLAVPPFWSRMQNVPHPFDGSGNEEETLEHYLQWRGWDVHGILDECGLPPSEREAAVGLLSHPLTFPLTMGRHLGEMLPPTEQSDEKEECSERKIRICCVGARAECTLPDEYWREFLIAAALNSGQRAKSLHCTIDFVGPDVPTHLETKTIRLMENDESSNEHPNCELTMKYHPSFLHEVVLRFLKALHVDTPSSSDRTEEIRHFWDGFVLFNPGLGQPNLASQWKPTVKFLVGTGKPVLFTAHSALDATRDRAVLEKALVGREGGGSVRYEVNPYASRMGYVDPLAGSAEEGDVHVVRPNHSVFLLR